MPRLTIDGKVVDVREGAYVLEAARKAGVEIPALCNHEALEPWGGCRLCMVDVTFEHWDGWYKAVAACLYPVAEGLIVETRTERVTNARKVVLDLLLARCPDTPLIQRLAEEHGITQTSFARNPEQTDCILCGLCTRVCDHLGISAISMVDRGIGREVAPPFKEPPPDCIGCLACAEICPTDHIDYTSTHSRREIWGKSFEMLRCKTCGKAHITVAQADFFADRNGVPRSYFETCDDCKRKAHADIFERLGTGP